MTCLSALMLYTERRGIKQCINNMNGKFLHDMLVNWLYDGIITLLFLWWAITVEPVLKGTCIERPPVLWPPKNSLNKQLTPTCTVLLWLVLSQKRCGLPCYFMSSRGTQSSFVALLNSRPNCETVWANWETLAYASFYTLTLVLHTSKRS